MSDRIVEVHFAMGPHGVLFSRRYRAALLDYLLRPGETGLARAYDLGRRAIDDGLGLLSVVQAHRRALNGVLAGTPTVPDAIGRFERAETFLLEALSPFELTYRGYLALRSVNRGGPRGGSVIS